MSVRVKQIGSFPAVDAQGRRHTVYIFQPFETTHGYGGNNVLPGTPSLKLADGSHVNHVSKGVYETVPGNVRLTSDDPAAV